MRAGSRSAGKAVLGIAILWLVTIGRGGFPRELDIVFTQLSAGAPGEGATPRAGGLLRADYGAGARLVRLRPGGQLSVLSGKLESACDPDVSSDGERVLFAGREKPDDLWSIWEVRVDGTGLRRVTRESFDCRSPIYCSTLFTLNSPEPWYIALFVGTDPSLNEHGSGPSTSLYTIKLDGTETRRITFRPGNEFDPFLLSDGRVVYSAWRTSSGAIPPPGRISLFAVFFDGLDGSLYGGEQGAILKHMTCATAGGLVVFVEADRFGWDGAGRLGGISQMRPHHSYRSLTEPEDGLFHSPSPLSDGAILVSRRPADGSSTFGIHRFDPQTRRSEPVFDSPLHDIQAREVAPRSLPDGKSTVADPSYTTGLLYCLNSYEAEERLSAHLEPGTIRRVRVLEGVLTPAARAEPTAAGAALSGDPVALRVLGEVPVDKDGSFNVEIPADAPIALQTLDADGMALATCRWTWVKPRETRGCIGCHEDPELTPGNVFVQAVRRPSYQLTLSPSRRRYVTFRDHVLPIVREKCATSLCHAAPRTPLRLAETAGAAGDEAARRAFDALLAGPPTLGAAQSSGEGAYVDRGRARTSHLIWRLLGRNTSRPWDAAPRDAGRGGVKIMPPAGAQALSEAEKRTFVEWIDLGAPWAPPADTLPESWTEDHVPKRAAAR
ncbi:MAG: hypothetical protein JXA90_02865 [Planctomycetes bacterium]|nr:hypothetical protein [Planctomycetota bacterium]